MLESLTRRQILLLAAIIAGSAVSGYFVPTEAAKLIATNQIADGAITTPKLSDGAVTLAKFGTGVADSLKGTNGIDGNNGVNGTDGTNGTNGINCWDLNGDRLNDESEDANNDNKWDALDCQGSVQFVANTPPDVDAGDDQDVVGVAGCGVFGGAQNCGLACEFDVSGEVSDDIFTGYLAHKWSSNAPSVLGFEHDDQLATGTSLLIVSPTPITTPVIIEVMLTADDGILTASDAIQLTCRPPAA